jgi:hypothetical protein
MRYSLIFKIFFFSSLNALAVQYIANIEPVAYNFSKSTNQMEFCQRESMKITDTLCNPTLLGVACSVGASALGTASESAAIGLGASASCIGIIKGQEALCESKVAENNECFTKVSTSLVIEDKEGCIVEANSSIPQLIAKNVAECNRVALQIKTEAEAGIIKDQSTGLAYAAIAASALGNLMALLNSSKKSKEQLESKTPALTDNNSSSGSTNSGSNSSGSTPTVANSNNTGDNGITSKGSFASSGVNSTGSSSSSSKGTSSSGTGLNNTSGARNLANTSNTPNKQSAPIANGMENKVDPTGKFASGDSITPSGNLSSSSGSSGSDGGSVGSNGSSFTGGSSSGTPEKSDVMSSNSGKENKDSSSDDASSGGSGYSSNGSGVAEAEGAARAGTAKANRDIASTEGAAGSAGAGTSPFAPKNGNLFELVSKRYYVECMSGKTMDRECIK